MIRIGYIVIFVLAFCLGYAANYELSESVVRRAFDRAGEMVVAEMDERSQRRDLRIMKRLNEMGVDFYE